MLRHVSAHRCLFFFTLNAEIGSHQGEHNSTKTASVEIIKFPIANVSFTFYYKNLLYV